MQQFRAAEVHVYVEAVQSCKGRQEGKILYSAGYLCVSTHERLGQYELGVDESDCQQLFRPTVTQPF